MAHTQLVLQIGTKCSKSQNQSKVYYYPWYTPGMQTNTAEDANNGCCSQVAFLSQHKGRPIKISWCNRGPSDND